MAIRFKHFGIHVYDLDKMVAFYTNMFGFVVSDYSVEDNLQIAFMTGSPDDHHQIVLIGGREPGLVSKHLLNQISYKTDTLDELLAVYRRARDLGLKDIEPVTHGNSWSCYFRDPEGNRQEVYCDTPWYITQPHFTLMDFDQSADELYAQTETLVRADPSCRPRSEWQADIHAKIAAALAAR
ncbi:VOC family protein [Sphingomonas fuzhouensis]|uniref:VOC family protein n=1 Tax=Sphingomonas fuzhouensis TaxID=3106033 RepID=UPI002AFDEED9|nr:VOC family protein [Sphingomonas sp. SGZ-02]